MRRYECLEHGCGAIVLAPTDEELVARVQEHCRSAHGSIELEDVVLAAATDVDDSAPADPQAHDPVPGTVPGTVRDS